MTKMIKKKTRQFIRILLTIIRNKKSRARKLYLWWWMMRKKAIIGSHEHVRYKQNRWTSKTEKENTKITKPIIVVIYCCFVFVSSCRSGTTSPPSIMKKLGSEQDQTKTKGKNPPKNTDLWQICAHPLANFWKTHIFQTFLAKSYANFVLQHHKHVSAKHQSWQFLVQIPLFLQNRARRKAIGHKINTMWQACFLHRVRNSQYTTQQSVPQPGPSTQIWPARERPLATPEWPETHIFIARKWGGHQINSHVVT